MKYYGLNDEELKNLIIFLDRVEFKGLTEAQAITRLLHVFSSPKQESKE